MHDHGEVQSLAADTEQRRIRHTGLFGSQFDDDLNESEEIDFKMVTFSLAGKEYGIDIMMVKEIAKFDEFTYVPNTSAFVSGVYNLRGDIISVIDMRRLFNLPVPEKPDHEPYDGLILRLESGLIGVVVDSIDKVVGIASETIQDPHPIFADVNLKYISGVVEHDEKLYIILDAERILGSGAGATTIPRREVAAAERPVEQEPESDARGGGEEIAAASRSGAAQAIENLSQTLAAVAGFHVTDLNRDWVQSRAQEWSRDGRELSLVTAEQCGAFLEPFYTPMRRRLWNDAEIEAAKSLFSGLSAPLQAWNPGCGDGYDAYALACVLRALYPQERIRIFASDNDLLRVSTAASLRFEASSVPEFYREFVVDGVSAASFSDEISGMVVFEFSELAHATGVPPVSVVMIRDVLSFVPAEEQRRVAELISEQIRRPGIVVTGRHEDLSQLMSCGSSEQGPFRAWTLG